MDKATTRKVGLLIERFRSRIVERRAGALLLKWWWLPVVIVTLSLGASFFISLPFSLISSLLTMALVVSLQVSMRLAQRATDQEVTGAGVLASLDAHCEADGAIAIAFDSERVPSDFDELIDSKAIAALEHLDRDKWIHPAPVAPYATFAILILLASGLSFLPTLIGKQTMQEVKQGATALLDSIAGEESATPDQVAENAKQEPEAKEEEASDHKKSEGPTSKGLKNLVVKKPLKEGKPQEKEADASPAKNPQAAPKGELVEGKEAEAEGSARKPDEKPMEVGNYGGSRRMPRRGIKREKEELKPFEFKEERVAPHLNKGDTKTIRAEKEVASIGNGSESESKAQVGGIPKDAKVPSKRIRAGSALTKEEAEFVSKWKR